RCWHPTSRAPKSARPWRNRRDVTELRDTHVMATGDRQGRSWFPSESYRTLLLTIASLLIAFTTWQCLSTFVFNPFLIPPPLEVIRTAIPMLLSGEIFADVYISMVRILVGFVTGSAVAIVMGVLLGRIKLLHDLLDPIIELLRYLSPTAMIPI